MAIISLFRLGEWVNVFNDIFCIAYPDYIFLMRS